MLVLERTVKAPDEQAAVYVFADTDRGHIVYVSHSGAITVVEKEKPGKTRATGFVVVGGDDCAGCAGC